VLPPIIRILAGGLLLVLGLTAQAREADIDALSAKLKGIHTYSARFEQTIYDQDRRIVQSTQGELLAARPGKLRWSAEAPFAQLIVVDGVQIWRYERDLAQVVVSAYSDDLGGTPALLLSGDVSSIAARYRVTRGGDRFVLTPRDPDSLFRQMQVEFRGRKLTRLELLDSLGQTTVLVLKRIRLNPTLDPALFSFTPPPGVDVLRDE